MFKLAQPFFYRLPRHAFLLPPFFDQLPKLRACAEFDLFRIQPLHVGDQRDGSAIFDDDDALTACGFNALLQVSLGQFESFHKISPVVRCGGLRRTARIWTTRAVSSTS